MSARAKTVKLVRRPSRAVPVGILAVVLVVIGTAGVWLLGTYLIDGAWPSAAGGAVSSVGSTGLNSVVLKIAACVVAVFGLALLLAALLPGRPARVRVLDHEVPGETALHRRDLARRIQRRAEQVDGVHSVRAEVVRRRLDVDVFTVVDHTDPVLRSATAAVEKAVAELRPDGGLRPRVRIHRRS